MASGYVHVTSFVNDPLDSVESFKLSQQLAGLDLKQDTDIAIKDNGKNASK